MDSCLMWMDYRFNLSNVTPHAACYLRLYASHNTHFFQNYNTCSLAHVVEISAISSLSIYGNWCKNRCVLLSVSLQDTDAKMKWNIFQNFRLDMETHLAETMFGHQRQKIISLVFDTRKRVVHDTRAA